MKRSPLLMALFLGACSSAPASSGGTPYDGTYINPVIVNRTPPDCPNVIPPSVTIGSGVATLSGPNFVLSGPTNLSGGVTIATNAGRSFQGQVDASFALRGRFTGPNCVYDVYWTRAS